MIMMSRPTAFVFLALVALAAATNAPVEIGTDEIDDTGKAVLWIAFAGLFLPTIYFAFETMKLPEDKRRYHVITFGVTAIASLAYLTMATGHGSYIRTFGDRREFFYARYGEFDF